MKTIACHLQKGGVGKTTVATALAWEIASAGYETVLVDCDPQGNTSSWLLETKYEPEYQLADVLLGNATLKQALIRVEPTLSVLPTFGLTHSLNDYGKSGLASEPFIMADTLAGLTADVCVLDMGPGFGNIEQAALLATDEVVLVMTPEYFGLDGLQTWDSNIKRIERGMRVKIHYERLVINGLNRSIAQMREVAGEATASSQSVYTIATEPAFRKSQGQHIAPQKLDKASAMKPENRSELQRLGRDVTDGIRR